MIGGVLGLRAHVPCLIAMSLFVPGVATFIPPNRIGPVGSALLSVQRTCFAFLGAILVAGLPVIGSAFLLIPKPAPGGVARVLSGSIAGAGIRIMAVSFGLGPGVTLVPEATQPLPEVLKPPGATPITLAGLAAILLSHVIPEGAKPGSAIEDKAEEAVPAE